MDKNLITRLVSEYSYLCIEYRVDGDMLQLAAPTHGLYCICGYPASTYWWKIWDYQHSQKTTEEELDLIRCRKCGEIGAGWLITDYVYLSDDSDSENTIRSTIRQIVETLEEEEATQIKQLEIRLEKELNDWLAIHKSNPRLEPTGDGINPGVCFNRRYRTAAAWVSAATRNSP